MWTEAGCRLLDRIAPEHGTVPEQWRTFLSTGFPWHRPDCAHADLTPVQWWDAVYRRYAEGLREFGCPNRSDDFASIRDDILDANRYSLFPDVIPVLEHLQRAGWRQLVVSNHVPELDVLVKGLGIGGFFDGVITSGIVGYEKPHHAVFEAALRQTAPTLPIWMIGDNPTADCLPVAAFGANAILVRTIGDFKPQAADLLAALEIIEKHPRSECR